MTALGWQTALRLGRVSNLPTVWTNTLAATALAGGSLLSLRTAIVLLAMSLAYVGGMYLNDAFDRESDARERPERPIPSRVVSVDTVFKFGFGLLAASLVALGLVSLAAGSPRPVVGGALLAAAILHYDWSHKSSALAPLWMGLCRALVYWTSAASAASAGVLPPIACWAGALLWLYVVGLTCAAAQENLARITRSWPLLALAAPFVYTLPGALGGGPLALLCYAIFGGVVITAVGRLTRAIPDLRGGISLLIAAISLFDALFAALAGARLLALLCLAATPLTRRWQQHVPGT